MTEDAKAAEAHAVKQCEIIQRRRDLGLLPYPIKPAIIRDFLAGVEHGRLSIEQRERMAWDAARIGRWGIVWDGVATENQCFAFEYKAFDDWKNAQAFDANKDEAEHLERIKREGEK